MKNTTTLRHLILSALALLLAFCHTALAQTLVTWNLEWFPGRSRDEVPAAQQHNHLRVCREVLQKLNPDIFIAQEVRDWQAFADLVSAVPGLQPHVVSAFRLPESGELARQQIGIASKLRAKAAWSEPWQPAMPMPPRGFAFAALESPDGDGLLMVYGVHLKSNLGHAEENARMRDESVRQLLSHAATMESAFRGQKLRGWIVAGDFNTNQDGQFNDSVVETLVAAGFWNTWKSVPRAERLSWRGSERFEPTTLDYVFTKGLGEPKAALFEAPADASDHWPVVVRLHSEKRPADCE
jgi:endonuclease/exonuclease/phosphatase family metal-dependent hydrolase